MAKQQEALSSVYNATRILKEFSPDKRELGVSELSHRLGIAKSTAYRLIKTLTKAHLVEQNHETQKYHLGLVALEMGFTVYHTTEIRQIAHPLLKKLAKSTRKVARLGVYDEGGVVYLCKHIPDDDLGTVSKIGNRVPSYCTAVGKVLLAYQDEKEIDRVLDQTMRPYTKKTIIFSDKLREQLKKVKQMHYAVTNEELRNGISSVAVPVYDDTGEVIAAISLTGTGSHFYSAKNYADQLNMYSRLITEKIGMALC